MSNIEDRLWQNIPTRSPHRELSANFTEDTMLRLQTVQDKRPLLKWFQAISNLRLQHMKPASVVAGVGILLVTAGTGYAALRWLQPHSTINGQVTTLANGNKRFWVHADSCQGQNHDNPLDEYFEIKAGGKTTPEQIRASVEAECEADLLEELFSAQVQANAKGQSFKPGGKQYFFPYVVLKSTGHDYIVVDSALNGVHYKNVHLQLTNGLRVYAKGQAISLKKLKPGDQLTLVSYTTALSVPYSTETMTPSDLAKLSKGGFPIGTKVEGIIQRQYDATKAEAAQTAMGTDWTRLVKDSRSPDGWSQLIPFDHNYQNR